LARKALYKHATQVDVNTHPDDGSSPVGSNEWNADPDSQGMLGFAPITATVTIASGVATVTDTITVVAAESSTTDTLDKLAITNTSQYDLVYLFADTGDTITLTNTSSPSADGQIKTVSDSNETLSTTVPTILIRKGNHWYGYGGGVVNAVSDIGDVTISSIASGELLKWNGSAWINQTLAETGIAAASHSQAASTISDFDTEVANNSAVTANTAKVTYPTADSNKLAAIEASATADQSNAEIVAAVEAGSDSNTFTDADHTKLNAIEASATADQSNAEIKSAYEANADSNEFSDAEQTKLSGIAASANNYSHTTNANLTGEVTSSGNASTITDDIVDEANLKVSNSPTNGTFLQAQSGASGGLTWASAGGGATAVHQFSNNTSTTYTGTASSFGTVGAGDRDIYIKKIDADNEGVFTKIWKNGSAVEVQIA